MGHIVPLDRNHASKRILVTGSNGLIGSHILKRCPLNFEITATSKTDRKSTHSNFSAADLRDHTAVLQLLNHVKPQIIFHTAAITSVDDAEDIPAETTEVNVGATQLIARWCSSNGCRLVHFSTDFVFDGIKGMYDETDEPNPISHYGRTKLESERVVSQLVPDHLIVRTILTYGHHPTGIRKDFVHWLVSQLQTNKPVKITADQERTPIQADDVAIAAIQLALSPHTGLVHIGGPERLNMLDFAFMIAVVFKLNVTSIEGVQTQSLSQRGKRPLLTGYSIERARQWVGFNPKTVRDGLTMVRNQWYFSPS